MSSKPVTSEFLQALPKCEHHIHIEGALMPELLFELSAKNNIPLPGNDDAYASVDSLRKRYANFSSLDDFLGYYYAATSALIHASDFEALAWSYFQHAAADGVVHADISFDPQAHTARGISLSTILTGLSAARARAAKELDISSELICCFLRHLPPAECLSFLESDDMQTAVSARQIVGIGLDSSERDFPPEPFEELYSRAKGMGLRLTSHAGEEAGPENIRKALDVLGVERIDHGISLVQDTDLMARVVKEGVLLTVCPLSNVVLRNVTHISEVPIPLFLKAGVKFSINSDDPAYFGGFIGKCYQAVQEAFGLSVEEWETIVRSAVGGSWCQKERKDAVVGRLEGVVKDFNGA